MYRITATKFLGYRILATIGLPLVWLWFVTTTSKSGLVGFVGTVACGALGWVLPLRIVKDRANRRMGEIDYELPELIDLLVVTVEAGLGFVGALQMSADRLVGPLGEELRLTLQEQNMGLSINEALANTMARCDTGLLRLRFGMGGCRTLRSRRRGRQRAGFVRFARPTDPRDPCHFCTCVTLE